jgi:hypothetical protein
MRHGDRGVDASAPRSTPLTIVCGAMAGDDLERVARSASEALGRPVAIALAAVNGPVVWPAGSIAPEVLQGWLEQAAAAAAVTTLPDGEGSPHAFVQALRAEPPGDRKAFLAQARKLGCDLSDGAVGICGPVPASSPAQSASSALLAVIGDRLLGLVPLGEADRVAQELGAAASAPRKDPALLHDAIREAELLAELAASPEASLQGQEETYRLLIGVLLHDREELEQLRTRTIAVLVVYDAEHDTELLPTLRAFLARHGSTTETADAMRLHRHTVGYRLSRVHEVSGLSPYESEGRERLSLGLKADHILAADERLPKPG